MTKEDKQRQQADWRRRAKRGEFDDPKLREFRRLCASRRGWNPGDAMNALALAQDTPEGRFLLFTAKEARSFWDSTLKPQNDPETVAAPKLEVLVRHYTPLPTFEEAVAIVR